MENEETKMRTDEYSPDEKLPEVELTESSTLQPGGKGVNQDIEAVDAKVCQSKGTNVETNSDTLKSQDNEVQPVSKDNSVKTSKGTNEETNNDTLKSLDDKVQPDTKDKSVKTSRDNEVQPDTEDNRVQAVDANVCQSKVTSKQTKEETVENAKSEDSKVPSDKDDVALMNKTVKAFLRKKDIAIGDVIDEDSWKELDKELKDFDIFDMQRLYFTTTEACLQFFSMYARVCGFIMRVRDTRKNHKTNKTRWMKLVCNREGRKRKQEPHSDPRKRRKRSSGRCQCPAFITFQYNAEINLWYCVEFDNEHNHEMVTPMLIPYMRSSREAVEKHSKRIKNMRKAGTPVCGIYRNLVVEAGDHESLGFVPKQLYNYCDAFKKAEVKDGDAETVLAYLNGKKATDPQFYVNFTRDNENRLEKLFWCDGQSRYDFRKFGQALAFDTTYKCNAYRKPFVVLVGVNNNKKTVPFACALIVDETEASYKWVLEELLKAGGPMVPLTVLTDGDKAMANAVSEVLPNARHRLCLWHMMKNMKGRGKKNFCAGFMYCVDKCNTKKDFETAWAELVEHYECEKSQWAKDLYQNKDKWAEAYMRGYFFAGMRSTQRVESMHRTLKALLNAKLMLYEFVMHYDQAVKAIRFEDGHEDYRSIHQTPVVEGPNMTDLRRAAASCYSREAFYTIQREMEFETQHVIKKVEVQGSFIKNFWCHHADYPHIKHKVSHDTRTECPTMYCSCMKLESVGFPCRHMFAVMKYEGLKEIPKGCILHRWTIDSKLCSISSKTSKVNEKQFEDDNIGLLSAREADLYNLARPLFKLAIQSQHSYEDMRDKIAKLVISYGGDSTTTKKRKRQDTKNTTPFNVGNPKVIENPKHRLPNNKKKKVDTDSRKPDEVTKGHMSEHKPTRESGDEAPINADNPVSETEKIEHAFDLNNPTGDFPTPEERSRGIDLNASLDPEGVFYENPASSEEEYDCHSYVSGDAIWHADETGWDRIDDPTSYDWRPEDF